MSAITAKASRKMKKYAVLTREPRCFLGSFDFSWEQRKLGELGTITTGSTPSTSIPDYYSDDGIVWVTPTDICENITFESARKLSDLGQQVGRVVPKNTILVTCIASIGKNTMLGNTGSFNQQINGLTPNEKECDPYFLLTESALWSAKMKSSAAAGTMQIVNRTEFSELKTWLPNLIEQQAISDFFRQLDNLITLHQRKCVFLFGLFQASISMIFTASTFSWEQRKFGEITSKYEDPVPTPHDGYYRLGIRSHAKGTFHSYVAKGQELETAQMHRVAAGNFIVNITFGWEHAVAITDKNDAGKLVSHRFPQFSFAEGMVPEFFRYVIVDEKFRHHLWLASPGGAGRNRVLKLDEMLNYLMRFPSRDEQIKIAEFFRHLDNLITLHQRECISFTVRAGGLILTANKKRTTSSWEQRKLGEIGSVSMCRRIFKEQTSETGDIPFYKIGTFGAEPDAFISRELFEEYKSKYPYPKKGDILISASGSIGRTVEFAGNNEYFQDSNIVWLSHDERLSNSFLKCFYSVVKWAGIEGSTIKRLYNDNILNTVICMPSVPEQEHIGLFFENLDNLITLHQRKPFLMKWRTSDANRNQTNRLVL